MKAGFLRHKLLIQSVTLTTDAGGGATEAWATITNGTQWGSVEPFRGGERYAGLQLQDRVTHRIQCRYIASVTTANTVLFGSRRFDVIYVINWMERGIRLEILATERFT